MTDRTPIDEAIKWAEGNAELIAALRNTKSIMLAGEYVKCPDLLDEAIAALSSQPAREACGGCGDSPEHEWVIITPEGKRFTGKTRFEAVCAESESRLDKPIDLYKILTDFESQPAPEFDSRSRLKRLAIQKSEPIPSFAAVGDEMTPTVKESLTVAELTEEEIELAYSTKSKYPYNVEAIRAVIAADRALRADGWVTVPREPTLEILTVIDKWLDNDKESPELYEEIIKAALPAKLKVE